VKLGAFNFHRRIDNHVHDVNGCPRGCKRDFPACGPRNGVSESALSLSPCLGNNRIAPPFRLIADRWNLLSRRSLNPKN